MASEERNTPGTGLQIAFLSITSVLAYLQLIAATSFVLVSFASDPESSNKTVSEYTFSPLQEFLSNAFFYSLILMIVGIIACIIHGFTRLRSQRSDSISDACLTSYDARAKVSFVIKCLLAPYFIASAGIGAFFALAGYLLAVLVLPFPLAPIIPGLVVGGIVSIIITVALIVSYLLILASSSYAIAGILGLCKHLNIPKPKRVLFVVLLLLPAVDLFALPFIRSYLSKATMQHLAPRTTQGRHGGAGGAEQGVVCSNR